MSEAARLLLEPFDQFPFVADSDRAAVLAALLTILARPAIRGPVPLFAARSPQPGTGKGLLMDAIGMIGIGRVLARMSPPPNDTEMAKRILALGLAGDPLVLIDNVEGPLGSPSLAAVLTACSITERILGLSKRATVPVRTVWFATGNNLSFRGDLGRRAVPSDLDAGLEHPEDRRGFTYPGQKLLDHIAEKRPLLVVAGLTLLRAYHVAGRPAPAAPGRSEIGMGSFEGWDGLIRGALLWAGLPDPVAGRQRIRDEGDEDHEELRSFLAAWHGAFGQETNTVAEAVRVADGSAPELKAALAAIDPKGGGTDTCRIGYRLRKWKDRIAGGLRLESAGTNRGHGTRKWRAVAIRDGHRGHQGHRRDQVEDVEGASQ